MDSKEHYASSSRPPMKGDGPASPTTARHSPRHRNAPLGAIAIVLIVMVLAMALAMKQRPHADPLRAVDDWDLANPSWWIWPLERNAFKRDLIRGNLRDVFRLPGTQTLWAVGESGLILQSRDGGEHWTQQHPAPPVAVKTSWSLISTAQAMDAPDKSGKAPYVQQKIDVQQKADPAVEQKPVAPRVEVRQQVLLPDNEPRVGPVNRLRPPASLIDSAAREPRVPADKADLNAVYFSDAEHGWAVGNDGALLVTRDGGEHWAVQSTKFAEDINGVVFATDQRRGWLFMKGSTQATLDGGRTWKEEAGERLPAMAQEMTQASGREVLTVRADSTGVLRDGGKAGLYIDGSRLVQAALPGKQSSLFAEWADLVPRSLQVSPDGMRILLVGDLGKIRYSSDAGRTWKDADSGILTGLQSLSCSDTLDDCIAVGDSGTVLQGKDMSAWRRVVPGAAANLLWTRFSDDGEDGDAVSAANIQYRTTDGGENWHSLGPSKIPAKDTPIMQGFVDGNWRWRVGPLGKAEHSEDGGKRWRVMSTGSSEWLLSVFFLPDHVRGWIAGADGSILVTRDGGLSWRAQSSNTRAWLSHISMDGNGRTGRALGSYGTVLLTSDGGAHWREGAIYRRYPAPWLWLALLAGGIALVILVPRHLRSRNVMQEPDDGPAASLNSDQPVTHVEDDRLGYRPAIEALADFLSNEATEPRITLAITGEWGSGKSSMMRMLQTQMSAKGYRTAWFNAWHHQQEGRQLTALFNVVRRQGVPLFLRQPAAALRVRSRLIWGRSAFYRFVCIAIPLVILLAIGDFSRQPDRWERLKWWVAHATLQWERVVITDKSIEKLKPAPVKPASDQSAPKGEMDIKVVTAQSSPAATPVPQVRPEVLAFMKNALVWESGQKRHCGDTRNIAEEDRCVFKQPEQLLVTIEKGSGFKLWPSERDAILKAAEPLSVPPLFPALQHFLVPLLGILGVLFTKGMTVYGLEVLRPLRNIFGASPMNEGGKEATGAIEHYRREFCLLTEALHGRLVIFIDDIDRCNPDTVNGIMELTNYLVDVGKCFVVLGMAMERVKASIRAPGANAEADYADKYLRKLVHIELPVPIANAQESLGLFILRSEAKSKEAEREEAERRRLAQWWRMLRPWLLRTLVIASVITAAALAVGTGRLLNNYRQPPPLKVLPVEESSAPAAAEAPADAATPTLPTTSVAADSSAPLAGGQVGILTSPPTQLPWRWAAVLAAIVLAVLAIRSSRVLQERVTLALGGALRTHDSDDFREALQIWLDAVRMHDETPRGIKRFCNRARLFAIYEKQDVAALHTQGVDLEATRDVHIVALAAIHHVLPEALKQLTQNPGDSFNPLFDWDAYLKGAKTVMQACLASHMEKFGWPDRAAILRFIERVERIAVR